MSDYCNIYITLQSRYTYQQVYTYGMRVGGFVISVGLSVGLCEGEKVGETDGFSVGASVLEDIKKYTTSVRY